MSKSSQPPPSNLLRWLRELRNALSVEFIGLLLFLGGGLLLLSLLGDWAASTQTLPWLTGMVGWTAPFVAISLMILGAVLMLGERAGYWSVEALFGAELLLLALQTGAFLRNGADPVWAPQIDGANGGLVGTTLGSLLLAALGRWLALILVILVGLLGVILVIRYTPLIYLYLRLLRARPQLQALSRLLARLRVPTLPAQTSVDVLPSAPPAANFVPAQAPSPTLVLPTAAAEANGGKTKNAQSSAATTTKAPSKRKTQAAKTSDALPQPITSGQLPSIDLLNSDEVASKTVDLRDIQQRIETTLADFNAPVRTIHVESGPTVTQFGVEPLAVERAGHTRKVRVSQIVNLSNDLALALAVPAVRIEAPVPGRPYVGIEVPNPEKTRVNLRGVLEHKVMRQEGGQLALALGRNTAGTPVVMDLTRAPHVLIAGATGSGKSACINSIISGLLMQHGPQNLRFVMVDPKMVELPGYNGIPHLLGKVITDVEQVMGALTWLLLQMDDRYRLFQEAGVRNIDGYNALAYKEQVSKGAGGKGRTLPDSSSPPTPLPYIVLIIDELADLMMTAAEDVERQICRLAQMARATGIHLILATQRPSIDVVTGLIKANFPTRIAFAVTSQIDSRVILDTPGAERLLGRGDMLLMRPDLAKLLRVQGCFVSDEEIMGVVSFWKAQTVEAGPTAPPPWNALMDRLDDESELLQDAIDLVHDLSSVNTSLLQRKLRVGYAKAARLVEQLQARGFVGPDLGAGQGRQVLRQSEEDQDEE